MCRRRTDAPDLDSRVFVDSVAVPHPEADREQYGGMAERAKPAGRVPEARAEVVTHVPFGGTSLAERSAPVERWQRRWGTSPGEGMAAVPDGRFVPVPQAGHSSNLENPCPVNDAVRGFFDELYRPIARAGTRSWPRPH